MTFEPPPLCDQISQALLAMKADPKGLGGMVIKARSGAVRRAIEDQISDILGPQKRLHPQCDPAALYGGLDPIETLATGRLVKTRGAFETGGAMVLSMGERCPAWLASALAQALDCGQIDGLIVFDESTEDEDGIPPNLLDRLAFFFDLSHVSYREMRFDPAFVPPDAPLAHVACSAEAHRAIAELSLRFGIMEQRPALMTLRLARYCAGRSKRREVATEDIEAAAFYTLLPKMQALPEPPAEDQAPPPNEPPPEEQNPQTQERDKINAEDLCDMMVAALKAHLSQDMLAALGQVGQSSLAKGQGSGAQNPSFARGRPQPARKGRLRHGRRIDLLATLRAAAPWQKIRSDTPRDDPRKVKIYPSDLHIKRFATPAERLVIFAVDASGSAAVNRLAEAKGAVELLLSEAYARRDYVALIAFRGDEAQVLLPPTRALVAAKRQLSALPGGGGTPLASGLNAALEMAQRAKRDGKTPLIAVLTDGRANISLMGEAARGAAWEDAKKVAQLGRHLNVKSVVLDMGRRANADLNDLANIMGAQYFPLPFANAHLVSNSVAHAMDRL